MQYIKTDSYESLSLQAAAIIAAQVTLHPRSVLGLATGSTPIGTYQKLVEWNRSGLLSFADVTTINLDEYCGLPATHSQSYRYFMNQHLLEKININLSNTHVPQGLSDPAAECARYDEVIHAVGGIDLQLLGLGHNGHIGFNEPADSFSTGTNCVTLDEKTIQANARFFEKADEVPRTALTMGMRAIMQAKRVLMVVNGADKAEILDRALNGPVTPRVPASLLQLHNNVTVIACL